MLSFTKKLTFEIYVLLSGVLENVFYLLFKLLKNDIFTAFQESLQEIINLAIIFRFSLIFLRYQPKIKKKVVYAIFLTLVFTNLTFNLISFINNLNNFITYYQFYETFLGIFYFSISLCLVFFGIYLKKLIRQSLIDTYITDNDYSIDQHNNKKNNLSQQKIKQLEHSEIYYSTRIKQINIVIFSDLITDSIELICKILIYFVIFTDFSQDFKYSSPNTLFGWGVLYIDDLCGLTVTLTNYIAFYYIIRKSYINIKYGKDNQADIWLTVEQCEKPDIKNYLSFYTHYDMPQDFSIID